MYYWLPLAWPVCGTSSIQLLATQSLTVRERPDKICFRFWQEGAGYDRNLYTNEAILHSIDYIHLNPIRRGLCQKAVDWKWSSARFYASINPLWSDPDLPKIHGLPKDWRSYEKDDWRE